MNSMRVAVALSYVIEVDPLAEESSEDAPRTNLHLHYTLGT